MASSRRLFVNRELAIRRKLRLMNIQARISTEKSSSLPLEMVNDVNSLSPVSNVSNACWFLARLAVFLCDTHRKVSQAPSAPWRDAWSRSITDRRRDRRLTVTGVPQMGHTSTRSLFQRDRHGLQEVTTGRHSARHLKHVGRSMTTHSFVPQLIKSKHCFKKSNFLTAI